jgi:integrase
MPQHRSIPKYRKHWSKDQGVADVYRHDGTRTKIYFDGPFNSPESRAQYMKLLATLHANGGTLPAPIVHRDPDSVTVDHLTAEFLVKRVHPYYRHPDGSPKMEAGHFARCLKPLTRMFGTLPAKEFDAACLEAYRTALITGSWMTAEEIKDSRRRSRPTTQSRRTVNRNIGRVIACFRWGVVRRFVPAVVVESLKCLEPLRTGDPTVRGHRVVDAVDPEIVEKCLPYLPPHVAGIVQVLRNTGARVGEICNMRNGDIDRRTAAWVYRPRSHKNSHRGLNRVICFGPRTQLILRRFISDNPEAFVFSPKVQHELLMKAKREKRKSKVTPSQIDRSKPSPIHQPGEKFDHRAVAHAIRRACRKADAPHWHVHQLRHLWSKERMRDSGPEGARASLGHATVTMTAAYAERDLAHAADIALKFG